MSTSLPEDLHKGSPVKPINNVGDEPGVNDVNDPAKKSPVRSISKVDDENKSVHDETDKLRKSNRKQVLTPKGRDFKLKTTLSSMKSFDKRLGKQIGIVEVLLSGSNIELVNNETNILDRAYGDFMEAYSRMCGLLGDHEDEDDEELHTEVSILMESVDSRYLGCKELVCSWLMEKEREKRSLHDDAPPRTPSSKSSSRSSRSKSSKTSSRSKSSNESKCSSHESQKSCHSELSLRQRAKVAGLKAEAKTIKKIKEAELSAELSRIEGKIKKAEAKVRVYSFHDETGPMPAAVMSKENVHSFHDEKAQRPDAVVADSDVKVAMIDMIKLQAAPKPDLDVFCGDPLEYLYFKTSFQEVVETAVSDQRGRLTRLIKYTKGEPKELIKHLVHGDPNSCYSKAISLLDKEYGNHHLISCLYLKEIRLWKQMKENDVAAYKKLFRLMLKCSTYKTDSRLQELDSTDMIKTIVSKLPPSHQGRWGRKALEIRRRHREASFDDLVKFLERELEVMSDPAYSREALMESRPVVANATLCNSTSLVIQCPICKGSHDVEDCEEFLGQQLDQRHKTVFRMGLCFGCLERVGADHHAKTCAKKRKCKVCNEMHPTTLHGGKTTATNHTCLENDTISMCVVPVQLWHRDNPNKKVALYALVDDCSQGTFISEEALEMLDVQSTWQTAVNISTLIGSQDYITTTVVGLQVQPLPKYAKTYSVSQIALPTAHSRPTLAVDANEIPTPSKISQWTYLDKIKDMIPEYDSSMPIGLMIGGNCPKACEPLEVIESVGSGPFAKRCRMGWCVVGPIGAKDSHAKHCNFTRTVIPVRDVSTGNVGEHFFMEKQPQTDFHITSMLKEMYATEFNESASEKKALSQEDQSFLQIMEGGSREKNGSHVLPLPFRNENTMLPNNSYQVKKRMGSLKRSLSKDDKKCGAYRKKMEWLIANYARKVDKRKDLLGKVWYIPHHGVYKDEKLRVVFGVNAKFEDRSLNEELLQGPDLTNLLVGVLARFRKEDVAIMADVEAMFYQVLVPDDQRSFLRFFWWKDGNLDAEIEEYEMGVHVFGAVSSGGCANYALKKTADDAESLYGYEAAQTVRRDFYVDDWLKSVEDGETAKSLVADVRQVCATGGFNLTKFVSNSRDVLESVPVECRAPSVVDLCLSSKLPIERALGVHWCVEQDTLSFRIQLKDKPLTKRGILGTISSIYDPLGLASPFVLAGRKILQNITKLGGSWDDPISLEMRARWEKWRGDLPALQDLKIRRCYKPPNFKVVSTSLHCFSDSSSDNGYGQASYLRQVSDKGEVSVSLVMAKSRVIPSNPPTVPRLELTAALLSAKVGSLLLNELDIRGLVVKYWVDSMIVLGYIQNDSKRFRTYVATRTKKIRDMTDKRSWSHVSTEINPADDASRGLSIHDKEKVQRWFYGPQFLKEMDDDSLPAVFQAVVADDDPEVYIQIKSNLVQKTENEIFNVLGMRISSWMRMKRVVATMMAFGQCLRRKRVRNTPLVVEEVEVAEIFIVKMIQAKHFFEEVEDLKKNKMVKKSSKLRSLDPFLDERGILCVGGRLQRTSIPDRVKRPAILPKNEIVVQRLIEWYHRKVKHLGRTTTIGEIRAHGYWLICTNNQVRQVVRNCIPCKVKRGLPVQQKMADLPESRSTIAPPFTYCGVDLFGPFLVKEGRKEMKRYGVVFTCFACRAIHLECAADMDTDSFILALRRFLCRRGPVRCIQSDNGGNFVGTDNEMKKAMKEMDHEKIKNFLLENSCDWEWLEWRRNPASASHMGGVWERQIRSIRSVLSSLLKEHASRLNDEALRTFFVEVESIVNSRPLCADLLSDESIEPLTPNHLLTMKSKVVLPPPGIFQRTDVYCRKRWRAVQYLSNQFWDRWRKEFLLNLQHRPKWDSVCPNLEVGDLVLVSDMDTSRNRWPMARIVNVKASEDGVVRRVEVKVNSSDTPLSRPVSKLVLLMKCPQS